MACVALTSLISTIELQFLQPSPRVRLSLHHHDRRPIISFLAHLSSFQAFLQNKSSGCDDGGAVRELEIQIRDFALQVEDDIEIQLNNIIVLAQLEDYTEYREKASHELLLHQTLGEAAKNATELLRIITTQEEWCVSEREKGIVALTILITKFKHHFLQPFPTVYLGGEAALEMVSFLQNLSSLQACLLQGKSNGAAAIKILETKIRNLALKAEDDIEIQLSNFLLAKHIAQEEEEEEEEASQQLRQTLQEASEITAELLGIMDIEEEHEKEREMTCAALTSLRATIDEMNSPLHYEAGIKSTLLEKLSSLQFFLGEESSGAGSSTIKIRNLAFQAKRDIRTQLNNFSQAKGPKSEEKASRGLHEALQEATANATKLLRLINSRSNEVDEANQTQPSNNTWLKHDASKFANVESSDGSKGKMVGRHHDCTVIKDQLFSSRYKQKIISIVGMVGIGKTTLATKLYEDPSLALHFDVRGWVTIPPPQHYNKSQMLRDLLQSITPAGPNVIKKGSNPDELQMQVSKCLLGRRFLIVLDNVLSNQALIDIKPCVPDDKGGSCILLTTRHLKPYYFRNNYVHNMTLLDPKESWELFCNTLSIEEHLAPKLEKIRNHVMEKCDGLPQLIVEVAKRLSKCNNIQQGWEKIEKELESLGILDRNAITVDYNPLPHHLKVCFLYFGVFPKRNRILVKMLIRLWIAEGFVMKPLEHKELEDQAYEYLLELIDRSLLLIENRNSDGKIKTCRMHSAMHTFCVGEAQKEGILCAVNTQQHSGLSLDTFANSCRWLSFYSHSFDYYVLFSTNIPRSIFFFHENPKMFISLKLLRVLAFDTSISLQRVPIQLGDLVFLRYLSITQWFDELDDVVSNNPNLETLVVSGNGAPAIHLPSSIWKPPHLRHVELGNSYMVDPPSADKMNLQILAWVVRPVHCRKKMYSKFPNIKNLKILLKDDIEPNHIGGFCSNPIILDHFDCLEWLEKLSISVSIGCNAALPEQCMYPSGLKKLKLSGTNISQWDLNVIAKLPQLMVLKLENAFHGTVWNSLYKEGFPVLIFLLLEAKELKQWVVGQKHFRMLRHLVLKSCNCLEQMPKHFSWLKLIELEGCHSSLVDSAKQLQQMRRSKHPMEDLEIKIHCPEYDDSQNTHTEVSI